MMEPARREDARPLDVRVGSSTNALRPILAGERPLGAGISQWAGLAAIAVAAVGADQLTKQVVARTLAFGEEVEIAGPFSIHHVHNSGIAFGLFSSATSIVIALTALAVLWMLVFFARSGARHPVLPVALGFVLGGSISNLVDRVRLGHVDGLPRSSLLARLQPRRRLHRRRRRGPLRSARRSRSSQAPARPSWPLSVFAPLRPSASIARSPAGRRWARGRSRSG